MNQRQRLIASLLDRQEITSQPQLVELLARHGVNVTQATVSRDLDRLGAVKAKRGGALAYALPDQLADGDWAAARLAGILAEWVHSIEAAGNLVVLRTPPGSAHLVGLALDQARLPEVAGTICGDDTIFVAFRDGGAAAATAARFHKLAGETGR